MLGKLGDNRFARFLAPPGPGVLAWLEAPAVVLVAVVIGALVRETDPLFLTGGIRWSLVAAMLVALRYGSLLGSLAMLTMLLAWFACKAIGLYPELMFPEQTFLGGYIIVLITGEFADIWRTRLRRAESDAAYALERLHNLTQRHVLLRLSHDRLEENLLTKPFTVRDALLRLREVMMKESGGNALPGGEELMNMLAEYCQLQRGALYQLVGDRLDAEPVAVLGDNQPLDLSDGLLLYAMNNRILAHVQMGEAADKYAGHYWVCAPIINSGGELVGVVVVERMPFLSINHENLQLLGLLLNFYADVAQHGPEVEELCREWPGLAPVFGRELVALSNLAFAGKMDTTMVLFVPNGTNRAQQIVEALNRGRRTLDGFWWVDASAYHLVLMMPMTGVHGFESFLRRIEEWVRTEYDVGSLAQAGVHYVYRYLDGRPVKEQIGELLEAADA
ncbi:PelD GGDEF domain-containing protein [Alloalcanivorax xenomutans]|uniref:PelD GGDEF domain-containing protein n=1 Tax=Alloalcanivorax xenomutans TaxID=1094342 RepID=UPI003BA9A75B